MVVVSYHAVSRDLCLSWTLCLSPWEPWPSCSALWLSSPIRNPEGHRGLGCCCLPRTLVVRSFAETEILHVGLFVWLFVGAVWIVKREWGEVWGWGGYVVVFCINVRREVQRG